jgi:transposase InsO family protein
MTIALQQQGLMVSRPRVARLMRSARIASVIPKKYVVTTDSKHAYIPAPNLLNRHFESASAGTKWVSDITYIKAADSWLYCSVVLDLYDRKVIGWAMSKDMSAENTSIKAMKMALTNRTPSGLIFHSDRGIQYACEAFTRLLHQHNVTQSMSRKGNCWDNAVAESFFKTLKGECTHRYHFKSIAEAKAAIFSYIEGWYNRRRIHSSLGYITPLQKHIQTQKNVA